MTMTAERRVQIAHELNGAEVEYDAAVDRQVKAEARRLAAERAIEERGSAAKAAVERARQEARTAPAGPERIAAVERLNACLADSATSAEALTELQRARSEAGNAERLMEKAAERLARARNAFIAAIEVGPWAERWVEHEAHADAEEGGAS